MTGEIIFWDESNSTVDDPISKGAGFGFFLRISWMIECLANIFNAYNNTQKQ